MDYSTRGVFADIARLVCGAVRDNGHMCDVAHCEDLRFCKMSAQRHVVVLGVHHLSRYLLDGGRSAVLASGFPDPRSSVLYNFEHVERHEDFVEAGSVMQQLAQVWAREGNLWDYSRANVAQFAKLGVPAELVPLGFHPSLRFPFSQGGSSGGGKDIDVLFYGRLNDYRRQRLHMLREGGVRVVHANAFAPVFEEELFELIQRSRIVLNLRYFEGEEEWKVSRFIRPLANEVLIVSETCGTTEERALLGDGVVFVESQGLVSACRWYLEHEGERQEKAVAARQAFEQQTMRVSVGSALRGLFARTCPMSSAATGESSA